MKRRLLSELDNRLDYRTPRRRHLDASLLEIEHVFEGTVLDIGGGRERGAFEAPNDNAWISVDIVKKFDPTILGDGRSLPVKSQSVDVVKCTEVMEHIADPDALVNEIARILKPRGTLVLSMPFNYRVHADPNDFQRFTEHKLEALFEERFDIERLERQGAFFSVLTLMFHEAILNTRSSLKRLAYPALPLLKSVASLDQSDFSQNSPYLRSYTTGYFLIAKRRGDAE